MRTKIDFKELIIRLEIGRQYRLFEIVKIAKELGFVGNPKYKNSLSNNVEQILYYHSGTDQLKRVDVMTPGFSNWGVPYRHEYIRLR